MAFNFEETGTLETEPLEQTDNEVTADETDLENATVSQLSVENGQVWFPSSATPDSDIFQATNWQNPTEIFVNSSDINSERVTPSKVLRGDNHWAVLVNYADGQGNHWTSILMTKDFESWQESPANPILENTAEDDWSKGDRAMPGGMVYDEANNRWAIFYNVKLADSYDGIRGTGIAFSTDLENWTKSTTNPAITPSDLGGWGGGTGNRVYMRSLFEHEGSFYGLVQYGDADNEIEMRAGLLKSNDLESWSDLDINPIVDPTDHWNSNVQTPTSLIQYNGDWMLLSSADVVEDTFGLYASSTLESQYTPTDDNPLKDLSNDGLTGTRQHAIVASKTIGAIVLSDSNSTGDSYPTSLYKSDSSVDPSTITSSMDTIPGASELEQILSGWWETTTQSAIEDWENGSTALDNYSITGQSGGSISVQQSTVLEGSYSLGIENTGSNVAVISTDGSGLEQYPTGGKEWATKFEISGPSTNFWWFGRDSHNSTFPEGDAIQVKASNRNDELAIEEFINGSATPLATTSLSISTNTTYELIFDWNSSGAGEVSARVEELDGTVVSELPNSELGISPAENGWGVGCSMGDNSSGAYFDHTRENQ